MEGEIISSYSQEQAVNDGFLVRVFENRWPELSGGKPIIATRAVYESISLAGIQEIWNSYTAWRQKKNPSEEQRATHTHTHQMNGRQVWLIEDGEAYTIMYPEDY